MPPAEEKISLYYDKSHTPKGGGDVVGRLSLVRNVLHKEYTKKTRTPWIIAYSGGKDSTLLLQLVLEVMQKLPPNERKRQVHIVANDTLVESPPVINHLYDSVAKIRKFASKMDLPVVTTITKPYVDDTFWVNVIGRGYIPPTRNFRWCTDRMKIAPTTAYIQKIAAVQRAILLIGTRKSESENRRRRMKRHGVEYNKMNPHNSIPHCRVFSPLADLTDDDVWMILLQNKPPWGGSHRQLVSLYRNAGGGECPLVLTKEDVPSCGTTSPRFGCWTCTVVNKDRSLSGLIDSGMEELEPLHDFREWLLQLRENDKNRTPYRRDGSVKYRIDGSRVYGPFKLEIRQEILKELIALEKKVGKTFLTLAERKIIDDIWDRDRAHESCRTALLSAIDIVAETAKYEVA